MNKDQIVAALNGVSQARKQWREANKKFDTDLAAVMRRLLLEAAHNFMSAEDVARASGYTPHRVRAMMRLNGIDPRWGKRRLSDIAAKALHSNAEALGVSPHEMDLTSPLAYLPMGKDMQEQVRRSSVSKVTDLPPVITLDFAALAARFTDLARRGAVIVNYDEPRDGCHARDIRAEVTVEGRYGLTKRDLDMVLGLEEW